MCRVMSVKYFLQRILVCNLEVASCLKPGEDRCVVYKCIYICTMTSEQKSAQQCTLLSAEHFSACCTLGAQYGAHNILTHNELHTLVPWCHCVNSLVHFGAHLGAHSGAQCDAQYDAQCDAQCDAHSGAQCDAQYSTCLLYTSPSPRDKRQSRMPSSA